MLTSLWFNYPLIWRKNVWNVYSPSSFSSNNWKCMSSLAMYYNNDFHCKMDHFTNLIYQTSILFKEKKLTESSKRRQKFSVFFKEKQEVRSIFQWGELSSEEEKWRGSIKNHFPRHYFCLKLAVMFFKL